MSEPVCKHKIVILQNEDKKCWN